METRIELTYSEALRLTGCNHVAAAIMMVSSTLFVNIPKVADALLDIARAIDNQNDL